MLSNHFSIVVAVSAVSSNYEIVEIVGSEAETVHR